MGRRKREYSETLKTLCYIRSVCERANLPWKGYALEFHFEPWPDGTPSKYKQKRTCLYDKYVNGSVTPTEKAKLIEARYPDTKIILKSSIWSALITRQCNSRKRWDDFFSELPVNVQLILNKQRGRHYLLEKSILSLKRMGTIDSLACILGLMHEALYENPPNEYILGHASKHIIEATIIVCLNSELRHIRFELRCLST